MKKITAKWLTKMNACSSVEEKKEAEKIGDIFKIIEILKEKNRLKDVNWLLSRYFNKIKRVKYAVFAAEQVIDIFEKKYPDDKKPRGAIEAAKKYIESPTNKNANAANAAANAANATAYATANAANATANAANAAYAAANAAYAAANTAYAAYAAANAANAANAAYAAANTAYAAYAAANTAYAVANANANTAERKGMQLKIIDFGVDLLKEKE